MITDSVKSICTLLHNRDTLHSRVSLFCGLHQFSQHCLIRHDKTLIDLRCDLIYCVLSQVPRCICPSLANRFTTTAVPEKGDYSCSESISFLFCWLFRCCVFVMLASVFVRQPSASALPAQPRRKIAAGTDRGKRPVCLELRRQICVRFPAHRLPRSGRRASRSSSPATMLPRSIFITPLIKMPRCARNSWCWSRDRKQYASRKPPSR